MCTLALARRASSRPADTTPGASEEAEEEGTQAQETAKPPLLALQRVLLVMASQCVGTQRPPFLSVALGDHMHSIEA